MRYLLALLIVACCGPALAQADVPLPRERPDPLSAPAASLLEPSPDSWAPGGFGPSPPEPPPPPRNYQVACPAVMTGRAIATALPPIDEGMCKVQSPLTLEAVMANGRAIPLSTPAITDCGMATVFPEWVGDVDSYLMARENTRLESVLVGTSYACRNVNNAREGNLSFHAFGTALDISGFTLEDGRTVTVSDAWTGTEAAGSRIVRFAHEVGCTHFTTVLGPEANEQHADHLHLDLGCHGASCVARICE